MYIKLKGLLSLFIICVSFCLKAQENKVYTHPDLFDTDSVININVTTNLKQLLRGKENKYQKARISYHEGEDIVSMSAFVKLRGRFRRDKSICQFPPLRFKFVKSESAYTIFHDQKRLKLVSHCRNRDSRYEQMLIQEYLAYKLYNILSPESFRVRMFRIKYTDTQDQIKPIIKLAFFIEDHKKMAYRNGKIPRYDKSLPKEHVAVNKLTKLALFQYMIGNSDWGISTLHNIKLIGKTPESIPIAVPYDFDWCSLVNAPYAVPNPKLNIESIHVRVYRGYKRTLKEYEFILREFRMKKELFYELYRNNKLLNEKEKKRVLNYLDDFYKIIDNPVKMKSDFVDIGR
ncbi:MAG: hypothetical protein N4A49_10705 [Marinifilaceae bacterium]|jgi:hypothetical protein|nr:hypothetical protein [Marinifilaceae bacterium]